MEKGKQSNSILRQNLSKEYKLFVESSVGKNIVKIFHDKKYRIKDTDLTYRTINHWEQVKLISSKREKESEWRKFSFIDLVWLRIISKIRDLNLPIETIKKIKRSVVLDLSGLHYFEFLLFLSTNKEIPLCLVAFPDGSAVVVTKKELARSIEGGFIESQFICVDMSEILSQTPRDSYSAILEKPILLATKEQAKILEIVKNAQEKINTKVSINIKNKKPVGFEIETFIPRPKEEIDIDVFLQKIKEFSIKDNKYEDMLLHKEAGKISGYMIREKTKLEEKPRQLEG